MMLAAYGLKSKDQGEITSGFNAGKSSVITKPAAKLVVFGVDCSAVLLKITSTGFHFFLCSMGSNHRPNLLPT